MRSRSAPTLDDDGVGVGVGPGDRVLIHVRFAMSQGDRADARQTRRMLESMGEHHEQELEDPKASIIE